MSVKPNHRAGSATKIFDKLTILLFCPIICMLLSNQNGGSSCKILFRNWKAPGRNSFDNCRRWVIFAEEPSRFCTVSVARIIAPVPMRAIRDTVLSTCGTPPSTVRVMQKILNPVLRWKNTGKRPTLIGVLSNLVWKLWRSTNRFVRSGQFPW